MRALFSAIGLLALIVLGPLISLSQIVAVFDTVYTPPGNPDGTFSATMYVPAIGNGIGIVVVHGYGGSPANNKVWCDTLASYGYVAMSINYPWDYASHAFPKASRGVKVAIEFLRRNATRFGITTGKIAVWGMSRGANACGETLPWPNDDAYFLTDPAADDHVDAAILLYGYYDYEQWTDSVFSSWSFSNYFGNDSSRYRKGSSVKNIDRMSSPVLFIHGTADAQVEYQQSVLFHDSLNAHGKQSQLQLFPGQPHVFDVSFDGSVGRSFTGPGLIAKDTALAFLRRSVNPKLKIRLSTAWLDFRNRLVSSHDTLSVRADNIGQENLRIDSIRFGGTNFTLSGVPSLPASIAPGASLTFAVAFNPTAPGVEADTLVLACDDTLHPKVNIFLRGKGISSVTRAQAGVMYVLSPYQEETRLCTMSPNTGALTLVGTLGFPQIQGMTIRAATNEIYGAATSAIATTIYRISSDSGAAVDGKTIPLGNVRAIAFSREDTLYGATTTGRLYRINLSTGDTSFVGAMPKLHYLGLACNPLSGKLWASVRTPIDSIFTLNAATGAATFIGVTGFNALTTSLTFDPGGTLYALIDNGSGEDYLATVDTVAGSGSILAGPLSLNYLYAIAMRSDPAGSVSTDRPALPASYLLYDSYPNPFNPTTVIRYQVPVVSKTRLVIYDVLGRTVQVLLDKVSEAGTFEVTWDAKGYASGVYYCRFTAQPANEIGLFSQVRKLLLLR